MGDPQFISIVDPQFIGDAFPIRTRLERKRFVQDRPPETTDGVFFFELDSLVSCLAHMETWKAGTSIVDHV
jgi:hypothetical protein